MGLLYRWATFILVSTLTAFAQETASAPTPEAGSTVSGHIYLGDTKGPAHRASVSLKPAADLLADGPRHIDLAHSGTGVAISIEAGFDGSFSFAHVPAGTYFLIADYPGYVSPYTALEIAEAGSTYRNRPHLDPAQKAAKEAVLKSIPSVTVQPGLPSRVDVALEHGAAISGTITYDDGSAAANVEIALLTQTVRDGKLTWNQAQGLSAFLHPDDLGHYRISGLPEGKYVVEVRLPSSSFIEYYTATGSSGTTEGGGGGPALVLYPGNTTDLEKAKPISLGRGEEHIGADFSIPASKFRTISGHIISAADGHVINVGQVEVFRADDRSWVTSASVTQDDSRFTLWFVYDGDYILRSGFASDVDLKLLPSQPGGSPISQYEGHPRHLYGRASKPLPVQGDMDGVVIAVPEPTAEEAKRLKDEVQRQEQQQEQQSAPTDK